MTEPTSAAWDSEIGQATIREIRYYMQDIARMFGTPSRITVFIDFPDPAHAPLFLTTAESAESVRTAIEAHLHNESTAIQKMP